MEPGGIGIIGVLRSSPPQLVVAFSFHLPPAYPGAFFFLGVAVYLRCAQDAWGLKRVSAVGTFLKCCSPNAALCEQPPAVLGVKPAVEDVDAGSFLAFLPA